MIKSIVDSIVRFIFARPLMAPVNRWALLQAQKSLGVNNYQSLSISGESFLLNYLIKKKGISTIFDVGAHKGDYAILARKNGFKGDIYLFEPHPETFSILKKEAQEAGNHHINLGLSDKKSIEQLYDYGGKSAGEDSGTSHASLYSDVITQVHSGEKIKAVSIKLETLDNFVSEHSINSISLLRIDVEGNELKALQGAKESLDKGIIDYMQLEFTQLNVVSRVFFKDFFDLLSPNYKLYRLLPNGLLAIEKYEPAYHEIFSYQNIVAIRKGL